MSFPKYESYRDSGVEWIGEVPSHWEVFSLKRDLVYLTSGSRGWAGNYSDSGALFIRIGNLTREYLEFDLSDVQYVDVDPGMEADRTRVRPDDILISITAYLGSVAIVPEGFGEAYVSQHVALARVGRRYTVPRWVGYVILSRVGTAYLNAKGYGGTKVQLGLDDIAGFILPIPSCSEQNCIAAFLDQETAKIDALVEAQRQLIELLKEKRQAVISHAVTKGLDPTVPMKDSGVEWLGEVPAHWRVLRLKFVATIQSGIAKGKDVAGKSVVSLPYLRVANVQDGHLDLSDVAEIEIPEDEVARYLLRPGDVLMNEGGDFDKLGRGDIWRGQIDPCVHQNHVFAVRPFAVSSEWLNALTGADYARYFFMGRSKQSTNLASISSSNILELPLPLPPKKEQHEILASMEGSVATFDSLVTESESAIALLQERRSALIAAAVTGKIDVRGLVPAAGAEDAA